MGAEAYPTLTVLGRPVLEPRGDLEAFPNPRPGRDYQITLHSSEFTCACPVTGQPDFAEITVRYIPGEWVVESKSWKLYLWTWRDRQMFHEGIVNEILDTFVEKIKPVWVEVIGDFNPRGGIDIAVKVEWDQSFEGLSESAE